MKKSSSLKNTQLISLLITKKNVELINIELSILCGCFTVKVENNRAPTVTVPQAKSLNKIIQYNACGIAVAPQKLCKYIQTLKSA